MDDLAKKFSSPQPIVVKGFKGEPTCLSAIKCEKNLVTVVGRSGKSQMTLKSKYVFRYDENAYNQLKNAYDNNDIKGLAKLWQQAEPILST